MNHKKQQTRDKYLTLTALILGSLAMFMAIYLITQRPAEDRIENYKTSVVYPTTPITLTLWLPSEEKGNLDSIISNYQSIHPNVTVKTEYTDVTGYQAKLLQAISSNTLPDLFVFRGDSLPLYKSSLQSAPGSVFTAEQFNQTFSEFTTKQLVQGNTIYGAPLGLATLGLIYNQNRFDQAKMSAPPKTWAELDSTNDKLRQKSGQTLYQSGVALGSPTIHNYPDIMSILMMQNGAVMTDQPPTKATFELPDESGYYPSAKAVAYYASFSQPEKSNYSWSDSLGDNVGALAQNKTALIIDYPMAAKQVLAQNPNLPVRFASLPQVNVSKPTNYGVFLTGGVAKSSPNSEIAWDFWGFATSRPAQKQFSLQSYWPASRKDLIADQASNSILSPFAKQSPTANDWYKGVNYATNSDMRDMLSMYLGGLDAQIAVKNTATKVTMEIQQSNK